MKPRNTTAANPWKFWQPIFIFEGEFLPKGYALTRRVPYDQQWKEPEPGGEYTWKKIAYPIPYSLLLSVYYGLRYFLKKGHALPHHFYRSHTFIIPKTCPHCSHDLYEAN